MTLLPKFLAGAAAVALLATAAALAAAPPKPAPVVHHISVFVPGYGIERVVYAGGGAPRVVVVPAARIRAFESPFAQFDRVVARMNALQAQMDRQMAAAMTQARQMQQGGGGAYRAGLSSLPQGVQSYSVVTTVIGGKVCTRVTGVTRNGDAARPQLVSNSSGDCGPRAPGANGPAVRASMPAPSHADIGHSI